jgi:hypothetical protein
MVTLGGAGLIRTSLPGVHEWGHACACLLTFAQMRVAHTGARKVLGLSGLPARSSRLCEESLRWTEKSYLRVVRAYRYVGPGGGGRQ